MLLWVRCILFMFVNFVFVSICMGCGSMSWVGFESCIVIGGSSIFVVVLLFDVSNV